MFLFVGKYWIPFPASEYGGTWVVMAENENQVVDLLKGVSYDDRYDDLIPKAVSNAKVFELNMTPFYSDIKPYVVNSFFT